MLKSHTFIRLVLVAVFLAVMVVSLTGGVVGSQTAVESDTIQAGIYGEQPAAVIACTTGDPGSSSGGCGGG